MKPEYILQNFKIYESYLQGKKAHKFFMNQISTDYIRAYKNDHSKLNSDKEKEVIQKLIEHFTKEQEFRRCAQLQRILSGEELSKEYVY